MDNYSTNASSRNNGHNYNTNTTEGFLQSMHVRLKVKIYICLQKHYHTVFKHVAEEHEDRKKNILAL